jgi:hypothetical protein
VKVDAELLYRLKVESARRRTTMGNLIGELIGPGLTRLEKEPVGRFRSGSPVVRP